MGWVCRSEGISRHVRFDIQLCWEIKGVHTLSLILVSFDMTYRIGPSDQLQGRLDFVSNIPVGVQGGIREGLIIRQILLYGRQQPFIVGHVFISPFRLAAAEPE